MTDAKLAKYDRLNELVDGGMSIVQAARQTGIKVASAYSYRSKRGMTGKAPTRPYTRKPKATTPYEMVALEQPAKGLDFVFVVPVGSVRAFMETLR